MEHVLVATLGDSPIVVTSMYNKLNELLAKQEKQQIDRVVIIHPRGGNRETGYLVIDEVLQDKCKVESCELHYADISTEEECFHFLRTLFDVFKKHQHDMISLSLAGGRKNMSVLMALVAPFYPQSLQGLYHILDESEDTDQRNIKSIQELERLSEQNKDLLSQAMQPPLEDLTLVPIPLENALRVSETYLQKLFTMTAEQLQERWEKDPTEVEKLQFFLQFVNPGVFEPLLPVFLTERAKKEFEKLGSGSAEAFLTCFKKMRYPQHLAASLHPIARKSSSLFYKGGSTAERPFFHTEPGDILNYPHSKVEKVIVERLAKHRNGKVYEPTIEALEKTPYSNDEDLYPWESILPEKKTTPSILIVPMGTTPMVATQLHTLLRTREKRDIQEVILLYLENKKVEDATEIAKKAFDTENIPCTIIPISGLTDITSEDNCRTYQRTLEQTIIGAQQKIQQQHPDWHIDLALSGGRKGMAALALFAAQRTQLSEVYHTLITDEALLQRIETETYMYGSSFKAARQKERNTRLFLGAYQEHEASFKLFKVPMGPLHGK